MTLCHAIEIEFSLNLKHSHVSDSNKGTDHITPSSFIHFKFSVIKMQ